MFFVFYCGYFSFQIANGTFSPWVCVCVYLLSRNNQQWDVHVLMRKNNRAIITTLCSDMIWYDMKRNETQQIKPVWIGSKMIWHRLCYVQSTRARDRVCEREGVKEKKRRVKEILRLLYAFNNSYLFIFFFICGAHNRYSLCTFCVCDLMKEKNNTK